MLDLNRHPVDFLYRYATHVLRSEMQTRPVRSGEVCSDCERLHTEWVDPNEAVDFSAYGLSHTHCTACHTLYQGSFKYLGVERMAGKTPVSGKLGMLTGCGMLVTEKGTTLFVNNGYHEKLLKAPEFPWRLEQMTGITMLRHLLANPPAEPFLLIGKFDRKKTEMIQNLAISHSGNMHICTTSGISTLGIKSYQKVQDELEGHDKSLAKTWSRMMKNLCRGRISPTDPELLKFWKEHPSLAQATRKFPVDPHIRLNMLSLLGY